MQATEDIKAVNSSMENKHFEWTCFQSQQSAEKSLRALNNRNKIFLPTNNKNYLIEDSNGRFEIKTISR